MIVVPSIWHEPFGYVVAEAILRGKLVIASRIGGIPELVEDHKGIFLFNAGNYVQLAESLKRVSDLSGEEVVELGIRNKETFKRRFENQRTLRNFSSLCEDLLT